MTSWCGGHENLNTAQKLADVISALGPAAETEAGRQWLIKVLHPSDPVMEVSGVPDLTSSPTVMLNYQFVTPIAPSASVTGSWKFDCAIIPDIIQPLAFTTSDMNNSYSTTGYALNPQLGAGASYGAGMDALVGLGVVKWRLAYMSASLYQDGPDLANQGSLVAAQVPVEFTRLSVSAAGAATGLLSNNIQAPQSIQLGLPGTSLISYPYLQAQPNAMFSTSKTGCYLPLHLDKIGKWVGLHDLRLWAPAGVGGSTGMVNGVGSSGISPGVAFGIPTSATNPTAVYPYPSVIPIHWDNTSTVAAFQGTVISPPTNGKWGFISAQNVSVQARMTVYIRMGFEAQVLPSSTLASLQKISPRCDDQCLASYSRIVRELKDAYPVDYNDLGKLWEVIKSAARIALPLLKMMPGPVGLVASAASPLAEMVLAPKGQLKGTAKRDKPPAEALERQQAMLKAAAALGKPAYPGVKKVVAQRVQALALPAPPKKGGRRGRGGRK